MFKIYFNYRFWAIVVLILLGSEYLSSESIHINKLDSLQFDYEFKVLDALIRKKHNKKSFKYLQLLPSLDYNLNTAQSSDITLKIDFYRTIKIFLDDTLEKQKAIKLVRTDLNACYLLFKRYNALKKKIIKDKNIQKVLDINYQETLKLYDAGQASKEELKQVADANLSMLNDIADNTLEAQTLLFGICELANIEVDFL